MYIKIQAFFYTFICLLKTLNKNTNSIIYFNFNGKRMKLSKMRNIVTERSSFESFIARESDNVPRD